MDPSCPCSTHLDREFDAINGLTWKPWVGRYWRERPADQRLLIVGESHYGNGETVEQIADSCRTCEGDKDYTRAVAWESLVEDEWSTPTLRNIPKLLFRDIDLDRARFWGDTAFYNFIQRPMEGPTSRPSWTDFESAWGVFFRAVEVLRPSFCLFIGVEAANSIWHGLTRDGRPPFACEMLNRVGRTRGRRAVIKVAGTELELAFVQHAGSFFSWEGWHTYLNDNSPSLMAWLREEHYARPAA